MGSELPVFVEEATGSGVSATGSSGTETDGAAGSGVVGGGALSTLCGMIWVAKGDGERGGMSSMSDNGIR